MELFPALAATWPPEEIVRAGPWTLRRGGDGGNRVTAATLDGPDGAFEDAAAAMRGWGQGMLFMIRAAVAGDAALDGALAAAGYRIKDPTIVLAGPTASLRAEGPDATVIRCAAPLACMAETWAAGGIGPGRLAVMARAPVPRSWLLARLGDRPAACAFVAAFGGIAVLHAVEVAAEARRQGLGLALTRAAAAWAQGLGIATLALAVTEGNAAARTMYAAAGLAERTRYHYRVAPAEGEKP